MLNTLETDKMMSVWSRLRNLFFVDRWRFVFGSKFHTCCFWITSNGEVKQNRPDEAWKGRLLCSVLDVLKDRLDLLPAVTLIWLTCGRCEHTCLLSRPGLCRVTVSFTDHQPARTSGLFNVTPILQHWSLYLESAVDSRQFFSSMRDQNQRFCWEHVE